MILCIARGYNPGRPESRPVNDVHWELIEHWWSSIQERFTAKAIITSIQRFLPVIPTFSRDNHLRQFVIAFFRHGQLESANVGLIDQENEDRYMERTISTIHVDTLESP